MESIKRSLKARKRRKTINAEKRNKEIVQSGMSNGYGEIEQAARLLVRVCQDCEQAEVPLPPPPPPHTFQDVMTHAKQTCAYITQRAGRDFIRLRFIQLLKHSICKYSAAPLAAFKCSACLGYADCKFSEDTEVVKEPKLQRFLEETFGVHAGLPRLTAAAAARKPLPPPSQIESSDQDEPDASEGDVEEGVVAEEVEEDDDEEEEEIDEA